MKRNVNKNTKYKSSVVLVESTDIKFLCQTALKFYESLLSLCIIILMSSLDWEWCWSADHTLSTADTAVLGLKYPSSLPGLRSAIHMHCVIASWKSNCWKEKICFEKTAMQLQDPRRQPSLTDPVPRYDCWFSHLPRFWGPSFSNQRTFRDSLIKSFPNSPGREQGLAQRKISLSIAAASWSGNSLDFESWEF